MKACVASEAIDEGDTVSNSLRRECLTLKLVRVLSLLFFFLLCPRALPYCEQLKGIYIIDEYRYSIVLFFSHSLASSFCVIRNLVNAQEMVRPERGCGACGVRGQFRGAGTDFVNRCVFFFVLFSNDHRSNYGRLDRHSPTTASSKLSLGHHFETEEQPVD